MADLGHHAPRDTPDRRRSVVYLEEAPQAAFEAPVPGRAVLDQRNEAFVPYVLAVTVGSTVDFPNSDRVYHNVFSLSKPRRFDLGRYPKGRSRSVRFDQPGVVRVFCEIHSHMNAFILVFAHRYFAATDADGTLPHRRRAARDLHPGRLERRAGPRAPRGPRGRAGRHGRAGLPGGVMARPLGTLRSRVFAATALVAVLPTLLALGLATRRVTLEAEAEVARSLGEAARLVEQYHGARLETARERASLVADLPKLKAAVAEGDPRTAEPIARDYRERVRSDVLVLTSREGRTLVSLGADAAGWTERRPAVPRGARASPGDGRRADPPRLGGPGPPRASASPSTTRSRRACAP